MSEHIIEATDATFAKEVLEESSRITVVDFWAPWCGPCKMIGPHLEALAASRPDIKVVKMNVDENPSVPAGFSVRSIPTLMLFKSGSLLATKVGGVSKADLEKWIAANA